MSETDISLCSRAVVTLGGAPFSSFSEGDTGKICANIYPSLRLSVMSRYPWRHLMKKKVLTREAAAPVGEWKYSFIIPGEAVGPIRAIFTTSSSVVPEGDYEVFGNNIYSNHEALIADFPESKAEAGWPPYFVDLMVAAVCAEIAFAVTDQNSVADLWSRRAYGSPSEAGRGGAMGEAMTIDAQQGGNLVIVSDAFVNARFSSNEGL